MFRIVFADDKQKRPIYPCEGGDVGATLCTTFVHCSVVALNL